MKHSSISITLGDASAIRRVLRNLAPEDRQLRFGTQAVGAVEWLLERLSVDPRRRSYVAKDGQERVGVLDAVDEETHVEVGLVILASHRRCGIGQSMVLMLLDDVRAYSPLRPIVACCHADNRPALEFLRKLQFKAIAPFAETMCFERQP